MENMNQAVRGSYQPAREASEKPKWYFENWLQLDAKIKNRGGAISPSFIATHFIERVGIEDTTKQSILSIMKVEDKTVRLEQIKRCARP